jgi:CheY-like chemotaxis protein
VSPAAVRKLRIGEFIAASWKGGLSTFDLVLVDISPPGINGRQAAGRLHRHGPLALLPMVAITAPITAEEETALRGCGVTATETRPIDGWRLRRTIGTLLRERVRRGRGSRCR